MIDDPTPATWEAAVQRLRESPDHAELVRDAYYDDPLAASAARYWSSGEWASIRPLLPPSGRAALDVGAGRGIASYALARDGFRVTAIEPDPSTLVGAGAIRSLAHHTGLAIDVAEGYCEDLPSQDGAFDVVFARAVLHHTRDLKRACREFFRVLRPGGVLLAVREHVLSRAEHLPTFLERHPLHRLYGGEHAFVLGAYVGALQDAGFRPVRVLKPLASPINHAPRDARAVRREVADRITLRLPVFRSIARAALEVPGAWGVVRPLLDRIDHRPGRLYSFVAYRP
jgi:2-polyprenyl-3-methyl-5-hydroxy-6-metoxy-1,4-benzoquinol methylase